MEDFECRCCVHGYHIYQTIWDVIMGETLECTRAPLNEHDRYLVAVKKDGFIIGQLPRKISRICLLFFCNEADA